MNLLRQGLTPKMKPLSPRRSATVSVIDIGTSKIACLIGRLKPAPAQEVLPRRTHRVEVLGIGHTRAAGIKGGAIVDLEEAERAIRHAVAAAERMAGMQLESVIVSVSSGRLASELFAATVHASGNAVTDGDIERVLSAGSRHSVREGRAVLHSLPIGYALDDARGLRDPRGMLGQRLGVDMHVVTVDAATVRNLMLCVERCHLSVEAMVATPYVAALSALTDDEADLGAAVVDMGAGTTTLAVFSQGHLVHTDGFTLGGRHVTMDLARGLNARIADAERVKTLYGSVLSGGTDEHDMVSVSQASDERESPHAVARATLGRIIRPRAEEILEMVRDRLLRSPFTAEPRGRIVLTGGASQLNGLPELAARVFGRQVRVGRPLGLAGLPDAAKGPAFAVAAGLLVYPQHAHFEHFEVRRGHGFLGSGDNYFMRVGRWLRESF
jgi:cell division protein FtsA